MTQQAGKCLIVEDHPQWQKTLREAAEEGNCRVQVAPSLEAGQAAIEREFFHVAVVDLSLTEDDSDRSGLKILGLLRDIGEGTQSILITAHGTLAVGFDVGSRYGGLGAIAKDDFAKQKRHFLDLLEKGISLAREEQARVSGGPGGAAEVEVLRGDREIYLWEPELTAALGAGIGIQLVHTVLHLLFRPLTPLMPPKEGSSSVIERENQIVRCSLWSRALGQAVRVVFGAKPEVDRMRTALPKWVPIVAESERLNLGGFALIDHTLPFDHFKSILKNGASQPRFEDAKRR